MHKDPDVPGKFEEGVAAGALNVTFEYLFRAQSRPSVWVHMFKGADDAYWILVRRIG